MKRPPVIASPGARTGGVIFPRNFPNKTMTLTLRDSKWTTWRTESVLWAFSPFSNEDMLSILHSMILHHRFSPRHVLMSTHSWGVAPVLKYSAYRECQGCPQLSSHFGRRDKQPSMFEAGQLVSTLGVSKTIRWIKETQQNDWQVLPLGLT